MKAIGRACLAIILVFAFQLDVEPIRAYAFTNLIAGYLFSKGVDYVWDAATGKPDIREINRRLILVEETLKRTDPRLGAPIGDLRTNITTCTSKEDLVRIVSKADNDLELRVAMLEGNQVITQRQIQEILNVLQNWKPHSARYQHQKSRGSKTCLDITTDCLCRERKTR